MHTRISTFAKSGLAALGLTLLLAACGGGGGGSGSSSSGGNPPVDTTPNTFTFTAQTGQTPAATVTSNEVTISGINAAAAISITGGEYSIAGAAFTSAAGTITNNQALRVRLTASGQFSTAANATVTVGGVAATFTATTVDADTTPAAFQIPYGRNGTRNGWVASDSITITDINTTTPVSVVNGEYSINGGAFTSAAGTITNGQSIAVRVRASADYSRVTVAQLTVGTVTRAFEATSELPVYLPDSVDFDGQDTIYLLNNANRLVFRWSVTGARYIDAWPLAAGGGQPTHMVYWPSQQKLMFSYSTGAITQMPVSAASPAEAAFATATAGVNSLGNAGNFLVAQTSGYQGGYIYNSGGTSVGQGGYYYGYSRETAWDASTSRLYYTRDGLSPNDLHYDVINQSTGAVSSQGETPYHGDYSIYGPIRVSANGGYVLLGPGDIYQQSNLTWAGSVAGAITDAHWFANGSLATVVSAFNQNTTTLRRLSATSLATLEQRTFDGQALRIVGSDTAMAVLVANAGNLQIHSYVPDDDSDDDGVENTADAFPLDVAASVDTDRDGYPDSWNTGRTQADSTTGLVLDAFPQDAACWLTAHGSGGTCNYGATIPNYVPDLVTQNGDIIYLLSTANRRVYRWSIATGAYLNPYVVGQSQGFSTAAPTTMALVGSQNRLYLGYASGAIRYISLTGTSTAEQQFANASTAIYGLADAGNFLAVQSSGGYGNGHLYNSSGVITAQGGYYYGYSREAQWDPVNSRLYYTRDGISPNDLHFDQIDSATGTITGTLETPYHGSYDIRPPIRVSANGQRILLGSGDIYRYNDLTWAGSVGGPFNDMRWLANGSLVTLSTDGAQTTLRRLAGANLGVVEQLTFAGEAIRVVGTDASMVVLVMNGATVQFRRYVPNDDSDGDGVPNTQDAFPLDVAASVDTDRDGYPDAWNAGRSQADSTTGLVLDAFPNDAACWLASHGTGGVCDYGATVPSYLPDQVAQQGDVIYLLSSANRRVYRWSISGARYMNPYSVGINQGFNTLAPTQMTLSPAHNRLYLGYENGAIRYIDLAASSPVETAFASVALPVHGLAAVGNYVLAQDDSGAWETHYIINVNGTITDQEEWNYYSPEYFWDANSSRVYFYRANQSPGDLHYEVIDQTTGQISGAGETPYHGEHNFGGVIRASVSGAFVLVGTGDLYNQTGLTWGGSLGGAVADARWMANGSLVTLTSGSGQTVLRRRSASNLTIIEQLTFSGTPLRVVGSDTAMVVLVTNGTAVQFRSYVPNDDSDGDGVSNTQDAFPLDVAASVDTDHDGYPDSWNPGRSQADSTTGLVLDAFPNDAACWLPSHGSGGVCNNAATIPNYVPDQVLNNGNVVYLLSSANRRVYRWSMTGASYLSPYVVGINQGFNTIAPTRMTYSAAHHRLYLGYENGAIQYIDTNGSSTEVPFATAPSAIYGLGTAGNYVIVQASSGYGSGYIYNSSGVVTGQGGYYYGYSRETTWDPVTSRLYYTRDGISPNDLHYDVINQTTGQVTSQNETPYHGTYSIAGPIRVSPDGQSVLIGSGDIYARDGLTWSASLGKFITDAQWTANALVNLDTTDRVEIRDAATRVVLQSYQYTGTPLRLVFGTTEVYLVHVLNGTASFIRLPFYDQDGDTIPRWWEQRYGLSDTNAADAALDPDSDGLTNAQEYANHTNPTVADTDGDGLSDSAEVNTHHTSPILADSDGDGLSDGAEINTHHTNPLEVDTDHDGYSDLVEVLYNGDPNDPSGLPVALSNYTQGFEGTPDLSAWSMPAGTVPWTRSTTVSRSGSASYRSGAVGNSQFSATRFRGLFNAGTLTFYARVDPGSCCNRLTLYVDGNAVQSYYGSGSWIQYSTPISLGVHDIEWRFDRDYYGGTSDDSAYIDDVVFTSP